MKSVIFLVLLLCLMAGRASAACLLCSCSMTSTGVAFGPYLPGTATPSSGQIGVSCLIASGSGSVAYSLSASSGSGTFSQRTLVSAGSTLGYNLYASPSYASVWGDGTGGTSTISDGYPLSALTTRNYTVYGRIPAGQNVPAGTYADTVTITISY